MLTEILTRLLWAIAIVAVGLLVYRMVNARVLGRAAAKSNNIRLVSPGKPAILYFTTPDCAACKAVQRPALNKLQARLGDQIQVLEIDAYEHPGLAKDWGVMSVPTTFILDSQGHPKHVNHGATPAEKLLEQLQKIVGANGVRPPRKTVSTKKVS